MLNLKNKFLYNILYIAIFAFCILLIHDIIHFKNAEENTNCSLCLFNSTNSLKIHFCLAFFIIFVLICHFKFFEKYCKINKFEHLKTQIRPPPYLLS